MTLEPARRRFGHLLFGTATTFQSPGLALFAIQAEFD